MDFSAVRERIFVRLPWLLIGIGILLRIGHYFENRSVWLDEACLTVSITSRNFSEIFRYFEIFPEFPKQPLLFLAAVRGITRVFGESDFALRLFPLLCSLLALILFYFYLKKYYSSRVLLAALAVFALAEPLVYYAAEVKQYSSDLLAALLFLWLYEWTLERSLGGRTLAVVMIAGALGFWFSNALVFVLGGFWAALALRCRTERLPVRNWFYLGLTAAAWLGMFALIYRLSLASMVHNRDILSTFAGSIYEGRLWEVHRLLVWAAGAFLEMFKGAAGLWLTPVAAVFFVWGAVVIGKKDRSRLLLLAAPLVLALLAAALQKYPFRGRLILFLVPSVLILLAAGLEELSARARLRAETAWLCGFLLLIVPAMVESGYYLVRSHERIGAKQVLAVFRENYRPGDLVVFNTAGQQPFWHYAPFYGYGLHFQQPLGVYNDEMQRGARVVKFALTSIDGEGRECVPMRYEYNTYDSTGHFRRLLPSADPVFFACAGAGVLKKDAWQRVWLFVATHDPLEQRLVDIVKDSFDRSARLEFRSEHRGSGLYLYNFSH